MLNLNNKVSKERSNLVEKRSLPNPDLQIDSIIVLF